MQDRPKAEDEVADVANDGMQRVDRLVDSASGLVRVLGDEVGDVFERQRLSVDGLNRGVVEVAADPLALVDDRQALHLVMKSGVVDGDAGVEREHLDEGLVVLAEFGGIELVREVQPTDDLAPRLDRHAQERVHLRMVWRKAIALRVARDVRDAIRAVLADDHAQEASAVRQLTDPSAMLVVDAAGDEPFDRAVGIDDPDRGVLGADQAAHAVGDQLEHAIHVEHPADAAHRLVERGQLRGRPLRHRSGSCRAQPEFQRSGELGGLLRIAADPRRADRPPLTRRPQRDLGSHRASTEVEVQLRQGRGVYPDPAKAEAERGGHVDECRLERLSVLGRARRPTS